MHELGIVIDIVKQIETYTEEHQIKHVDSLVLEIGELSGIVPRYIEEVYPIAIEQSTLKEMSLQIIETPGIGKCTHCDFVYNLVHNNNTCPKCLESKYEVISGTDFIIKEIQIKEE